MHRTGVQVICGVLVLGGEQQRYEDVEWFIIFKLQHLQTCLGTEDFRLCAGMRRCVLSL